MKYTITRVWHENTTKRGRHETVATDVTIPGALEAIRNAEASNMETERRLREHCMRTSDGLLYDFRDYTYRVEKA